ncbi:MAG: dienelactone hydrolase family protein [Acidobacteriota bacterium]
MFGVRHRVASWWAAGLALALVGVPFLVGVLFLAGGLLGAASSSAQEVAGAEVVLQRQFVEAYRGGDIESALRFGEELMARQPQNAFVAYDLARLRAARGEHEVALEWLRRSASAGFAEVAIVTSDADLAQVRESPEYPAILDAMKANQAAAWRAFERRVAEHPPELRAPRRLDPEKPAPLILALHGRGGRGGPMVQLWEVVARQAGAVLAVPEALHPYARGFQWGSQEETAYQTLQAIEAAAAKYPIDRECVVLMGFSQGGRRSISTAFRHPGAFAGVIVMGSAMDRETAFPDVPAAELPRFFFMVGGEDGVVQRTRETSKRFAERGIAQRLVVYPGLGHTFPQDHVRQMKRALRFVKTCGG